MLLALFLSALAFAYEFPYKDPLYATLTAAILKADDNDQSVRGRDLAFPGIPERNEVPYLGRRNRVQVRVWEQASRNPAPLLFLVAGLGGGANASYLNFLAYHFHKKGFHVVSLPSAFHWTFALSRSRSGYPGVTAEDASDLYALMQEALARFHARVTETALLGVSMGALQSAYIAALDRKEKEIGFRRVLLVNPPVDVLSGIRLVDHLSDFAGDREELRGRVLRFGIDALSRDLNSDGYFRDLEKRLPTSVEEREFLIGDWLKDFLGSLIFTTQQIDDRGVLAAPRATTNPDARLREAARMGFGDYIDRLLVPALSAQRGKSLTVNELATVTNLTGVEAELRSDPRVFLMHNQDDFLVTQDDLNYLRAVFGNRMKLYPYGGHVGNLWYRENLEAILSRFDDLR